MPCREVPPGPHEKTEVFRRPMTPQDVAESDDFMRRYREWKRNVELWDIYVNGAAPYWGGPRPQRPGAPPAPPKITNTACQAAAQVGAATIYRRLREALAQEFECEGTCRGGQCVQIFANSKGEGFSYTEHETFCTFTVRGKCDCAEVEIEA